MRINSPSTIAAIQTSKTPNFGLTTDGTQNYVDLGTMGTFGSSLGAGFYVSYSLKTTDTRTNVAIFGTSGGGNTDAIRMALNPGGVQGKVRCLLFDHGSKKVDCTFTNLAIIDGSFHTIVMTIIPSTNTTTVTLDGATQSITYDNQETPVTFTDFGRNVFIGATNNNGALSAPSIITIDNFKLGTSASNLFGSYSFAEGTGTTTADASGKGNTGTLTGTPAPTWTAI